MPYRFALQRQDYSDLAAGPVLYSLPGRPAFPVRVASEIFQRCQARLERLGNAGPYVLYDPCCGSAYLPVTVALLHWQAVRRVIASDVDPSVLPLAERNLSLLTLPGVAGRIAQVRQLHQQHGRASHLQALASAERLREIVQEGLRQHPIDTRSFVADALLPGEIGRQVEPGAVDTVLTDLPYGQRSAWQGGAEQLHHDPAWQLLEALRAVVRPDSIVAVTATKAQPVAHEAYRRVEQLQVGKRRTTILMLM
jgi:hypothetical protein